MQRHQEFDPSDELRDAIHSFWYIQIDFGETPATFDVVPDGYAEIIFLFGSPCSVVRGDGVQPLPSPFIMGLLNQTVLLSATGSVEVLGVKCYPWTVFDLLGLPSGNHGVHTFEHPIARLQSALAAFVQEDRIADAVAALQQYFLEARSPVATDTLLCQAGSAMREANGTLPVREVAAAAHATVRTLERKFKQSSGHSVKDVSSLIRFEQVRNRLWGDPGASLAALAQEFGYTDQSHLSREFKRFSGTTPAAFARKARQGKQAMPNDFVAFVQGEHPRRP